MVAAVTAASSTEASAGTTGRGHGEASLLPNPWAVPTSHCLHPLWWKATHWWALIQTPQHSILGNVVPLLPAPAS